MNRRLLIWTLVTAGLVSAVVYKARSAGSRAESGVATGNDVKAPAETKSRLDMDPPRGGEHELQSLETSLKKNPNHTPILLRMAEVERTMGKNEDAVRHLREAVRTDPKSFDARLELGRALFDIGDTSGAIRETEALLEIDPSNLDALYNLGAIYGNLGQDDRARKYWRKAVAISPESESGRRSKDALKQIGDTR